MKCIIPGANIKVFGKAVHSLSKIGDELYLEPLPNGLSLRTVNACRSAFACFIFAPTFFLQYNDGLSGQQETNDSEADPQLKCKIGMKSILSVFRSLSTLEKTVDRCKIRLDLESCRLVFQLYCRHGIVKTHNLAFIECETLQAVYSKEMTPNTLTAQSRLLADVVVNFQTNQEEISLIVNPEKVIFKNYVEDEGDSNKAIHTQLGLDPSEFENFQVGIDTEITFCLKELRAILAFSESSNLPLSIHFETPGKPVVFGSDSDPSFEASYVLATMAEPSSTQMSCSQRSVSSRNVTSSRMNKPGTSTSYFPTPKATPAAKPTTSCRSTPATAQNSSANVSSERKRLKPSKKMAKAFQQMLEDEDLTDEVIPEPGENRSANNPAGIDNDKVLCSHSAVRNKEVTCKVDKDLLRDDIDIRAGGDMLSNNNKKLNSVLFMCNSKDPNDLVEPPVCQQTSETTSPVIPLQNIKSLLMPPSPNVEDKHNSDNEDDDMIPGTPPSKKMRLSFFGLSQSTTSGTQDTRHTDVLAEDTDED